MTRHVFGGGPSISCSIEVMDFHLCLLDAVHKGLLMPDSKANTWPSSSTHSGKGAEVKRSLGHVSKENGGGYHSPPISCPKASSVFVLLFLPLSNLVSSFAHLV